MWDLCANQISSSAISCIAFAIFQGKWTFTHFYDRQFNHFILCEMEIIALSYRCSVCYGYGWSDTNFVNLEPDFVQNRRVEKKWLFRWRLETNVKIASASEESIFMNFIERKYKMLSICKPLLSIFVLITWCNYNSFKLKLSLKLLNFKIAVHRTRSIIETKIFFMSTLPQISSFSSEFSILC